MKFNVVNWCQRHRTLMELRVRWMIRVLEDLAKPMSNNCRLQQIKEGSMLYVKEHGLASDRQCVFHPHMSKENRPSANNKVEASVTVNMTILLEFVITMCRQKICICTNVKLTYTMLIAEASAACNDTANRYIDATQVQMQNCKTCKANSLRRTFDECQVLN